MEIVIGLSCIGVAYCVYKIYEIKSSGKIEVAQAEINRRGKLYDSLIYDYNNLVDGYNKRSRRIGDLERKLAYANHTIRNANVRINELKSNSNVGEVPQVSDYTLLGVNPDTDKATIKKRYKTLSAVYHPDKGGSDLMMKRINAAYERIIKG